MGVRARQAVIVLAAIGGVGAAISAWLDASGRREAQGRLRALVPRLEEAYAAYAECFLATPTATPWDAWAAGVDLEDRARFCERQYRERIGAAGEGLGRDDRRRLARLLDAQVPSGKGPEGTARSICASLDRRRARLDDLRAAAGLDAAPGGDCDGAIDDLRAPVQSEAVFARAFGVTAPMRDLWMTGDADGIIAGVRWEAGGATVARSNDGTMWERVAVDDALAVAWPAAGPWAVTRAPRGGPPRVRLRDGARWRDGAALPGVTEVHAMQATSGGRTLVVTRHGALAVLRLDEAAARVVEDVPLPPAAGHLAACIGGDTAFVQVGDRVLAGAAPLGAVGRDAPHHLACGDGWVAAIDHLATQYTLCRAGAGCQTRRISAREAERAGLAVADEGVVILARTKDGLLASWRDLGLDGTLALDGVWRAPEPYVLVHLHGAWVHLTRPRR